MKKLFIMLLTLTIITTWLSGCGGKNSSKKDREISSTHSDSSDTSTDPNLDTSSNAEIFGEGTISSLDEIKNKLIESGYQISDLMDIQKQTVVNLVDGFNFSKGDEYNFVMEFATPKDAKANADMVIESGYQVPIVNGRFVAYVTAENGIVTDLELQAELEKIMDAKALVADQSSDTKTKNVSTKTTDYKEAYELMHNITESMNTMLDKALSKNNNEHPQGDPQNTENVFVLMFGSISMALTSQFCENEQMLKGVEMAAEMFGLTNVKVTRNKAHDYTLTATQARTEGPYELHGVYDPTSGGLRMVEKTDGKVTTFFEFIPLGSDQYALQTRTERGIVNYKDGKVLSFVYTMLYYDGNEYNSESDSIYPSGSGANIEWAASKGEDEYSQYIKFDGKNFKINVQTFGERVKVEIPS